MSSAEIAYPKEFLHRLETVWGRGFLSPGGPDEVVKVVEGLETAGKTVLDIGCGTAGPALVLAGQLQAERVLGIDVEADVLARAKTNVTDAGLGNRIELQQVEPGPLPLPDNSFDLVFSKDAMLHIPDKQAMFKEVLRVLRPGAVFAASDWLGGENTATSPEWARYCEFGHLSFTMVTAGESEAAMRAAGFENVSSRDRNAWYAGVCAEEVRRIAGPLRETLLSGTAEATYLNWLKARRALADAVAVGAMRPTHLRGYKL